MSKTVARRPQQDLSSAPPAGCLHRDRNSPPRFVSRAPLDHSCAIHETKTLPMGCTCGHRWSRTKRSRTTMQSMRCAHKFASWHWWDARSFGRKSVPFGKITLRVIVRLATTIKRPLCCKSSLAMPPHFGSTPAGDSGGNNHAVCLLTTIRNLQPFAIRSDHDQITQMAETSNARSRSKTCVQPRGVCNAHILASRFR